MVSFNFGLDSRIFSNRSFPDWDPSSTWLANLEKAHKRKPLHAVVATAACTGRPWILQGDDCHGSAERWEVETSVFVPREAATLLLAVSLLLEISSRVLMIDPHFRADAERFRKPIQALFGLLRQKPPLHQVEVHSGLGRDVSYDNASAAAKRYLPPELPRGAKVKLCFWAPRTSGERLHNRYLLTDIGGVQFGDSIEQGKPGELDRLSILSERDRQHVWSLFVDPPYGYDPAGDPIVIDGAT